MHGKRKPSGEIIMALAGTPNVGKSAIFHQMTGADVIISNYPGTTVELTEGKVKRDPYEVRVIDLPGVYSFGTVSDEEVVARRAILEQRPDVIVNIVDASNLERSLYLTIQLLRLGYPMLVVLNMYDVASKKGVNPDPVRLSKKLGVPVIQTVATRGENVSKAFDEAVKLALNKKPPRKVIRMGRDLEEAIEKLSKAIRKNLAPIPLDLPARTLAIKLLEGDAHLTEAVALQGGGAAVLMKADELARKIRDEHGEPAAFRIARERHGIASLISREVTDYAAIKPTFSQKLSELTTNMKTGVPIMVAVFAALLLLIIYVGGFLEGLLVNGWEAATSGLSFTLKNSGAVGEVLEIGLIQGISGILAVMIPYILVFFLALAILEDTGYLPRMAFVMDSAMHKIGLHGGAVVPMLGGFGCNVPAIMSTRVLITRRERIISSFLITMIPCSARTAVILGTVGFFIGVRYALVIYGIILGLIFLVGLMLNRILPGRVPGMIMEMPPLRVPTPKPVLFKTWVRMRSFLYIAAPLLIVGSLTVGALHVSGTLNRITGPLSPVTTGLLGLPAVAIIPLIYGFIRKEGAIVLLAVVAGTSTSKLTTFMSPLQLFVFALVVAIYIPCIATIAVLGREVGWKWAAIITVSTFLLALVVGGLVYHLNPLGLAV
jgi:ferrous iron transport protein B